MAAQTCTRTPSAHGHHLLQYRAFSRTTACSRGALPVFVEPSTPAISTLLATFNSKVLLPLHLTKEQQKLVYAKANRAKLDADPIEITLGDVTLPLEHIDRNRLPDRFQSIRNILRLSETREDWENVVKLLEGAENAGLHMKPHWHEMVVRRLNLAGMQHLVFKALQRVKATGLRLSDHGLLMQVLRGLHDKAALADWQQEETTKALRMARQVTELMEDEEHHGGRTREATFSNMDHRRDPILIALPTELAAVLAQRHGGDVDQVKKLANRLVTALKQSDYATQLNSIAKRLGPSSSGTAYPNRVEEFFLNSRILLQLIIVWNALRTSQTVLGTDMPMADEAKAFETRLEQLIDEGMKALPRSTTESGKSRNNEVFGYLQDAIERCQRG